MSWKDWPHPMKPYTDIPTFEVDPNASAQHKVGELHRGDYHIDWALDLMGKLNRQFLKNATRSGFDRAEILDRLERAIREEPKS